jgi:hypothetical protein
VEAMKPTTRALTRFPGYARFQYGRKGSKLARGVKGP